VTPLERRCRWLLLAYPTWYRRERAGEMVSRRELGIVAAWLVLGAVMTSILAAQRHSRNAPETSRQASL
jgi:hypothetical protein